MSTFFYSNSTTGNSSVNQNNGSVVSNSSMSITQNSDTTNGADFSVTTGNNEVTSNTTVTGLGNSGDVAISITGNNRLNSEPVSMVLPAGESVTFSSNNSNTGNGSTNSSNVSISNSHVLSITNSSSTSNSVHADINTGGNMVDGNTSATGMGGGGVSLNVTFGNVLNSGGVTTPVVPVVPGAPVVPVYTGMGGDFLPLPGLPTIAGEPISVSLPVQYGVGGGYVAAGSSALAIELGIFAVIAAAVVLLSGASPARRFASQALQTIRNRR